MKILLSSANFCDDPIAVYPIGMSVIAAVLSEAGHQVRQFDPMLYGQDGYLEAAQRLAIGFKPDLIGISMRNLDNVDSCVDNSEFFKIILEVVHAWRSLVSAPMVIGGTGFSMYPERILELSGAEYGIVGEGENAILELVGALAAGNPPPRGTILRRCSDKIYGGIYVPEIASFYDRETHIIPLQTKRGCPFKCVYCTYPMLEGRFMRVRELDDVLRDIEQITNLYPDSMIYFSDSVFNDPARHFEKLIIAMIQRGINVPWTAFITPSGIRDGDLQMMAESGLVLADLGVDAASDQTLAGMGKNFTFEEVAACCCTLLDMNIGVTASVMFGGPGETWETVDEGMANLRSIEPAYSIIFPGIRVFDGAPLIEIARREGAVPPGWDGTVPLYYFAPGIDQEQLHLKLLEGFKGSRYCVYPPSSRNQDLRMINKFGYSKLRNLQLGALS